MKSDSACEYCYCRMYGTVAVVTIVAQVALERVRKHIDRSIVHVIVASPEARSAGNTLLRLVPKAVELRSCMLTSQTSITLRSSTNRKFTHRSISTVGASQLKRRERATGILQGLKTVLQSWIHRLSAVVSF